VKILASKLRESSKESLLDQLKTLRQELSQLRVTQASGGANAKLSKIRVVRKSIARVLTVYNQEHKDQLRAAYKGKKYIPKALRPKLTRAKRRALTKEELSKKVSRVEKRQCEFPRRKYAIKF